MKTPMTLSTALILATLTACGGGGGGGGDGSAASAETSNTAPSSDSSTAVAATPSEAATTSELVVPAGFDMEQDYLLTINANAADFGTDSAYLSICSDFSESDGTYDIDFSSCIVKATFAPEIEQSLQIPNDVETLVAAVFFLNGESQPVFSRWQRSGDSEEYWRIR